MKPSFWILITILFWGVSCASSNKLTLKEREKEKLIVGKWTNNYGYVAFEFAKGGKTNPYKIMWPGSRSDLGTWRIANNGIKLFSDIEGREIYGDVVKLDEDNLVVQFDNGEEYELKRDKDKK